MNPADTKTWIQTSNDHTHTYLGTHQSTLGIDEHVGIPDTQRLMHTLNIGPTGAGKSQLMLHAALQDAYKDHGLALIVPKGRLIDEFLAKLPADRLDDIIYINPNKQRVPAINVLNPYTTPSMTDAERDTQQNLIIDDITAIFRRLSQDWGERWGRNLRTLLHTHIHLNAEHNAQNTLMDVFRCVTDKDALQDLLDQVHQPLLYEELTEIQQLSDREMEPLQRRFRDFLESSTVRRVITQQENTVNFQDILNDGKILLVDVQKGQLGTTAATLIGGIIITRIWSAAQSRITLPEDQRQPFYLYIDELHSFSGEGSNFQTMLSEAREYKLGCFLATQYLRQLERDMRSALIANCRTKIFFDPSSSEDFGQITNLLQGISKDELKHLGNYRAALHRPDTHRTQDTVLIDTYPPWETDMEQAHSRKQALLDQYDILEDHTAAITGQKGESAAAGGEFHADLLEAAHRYFTDEYDWQVNLLYQDGDERPDGHIMANGETKHLEAEHSTLSKPAKVLHNLQRAAEQGQECVFVVEHGNGQKLANILADPVNRRGDMHEDETGTYSYYTADDEPFTAIDAVADAAYTIYTVRDDDVAPFNPAETPDCPELAHTDRASLVEFCLYRDEDGYCSQLGQPCVLNMEGET